MSTSNTNIQREAIYHGLYQKVQAMFNYCVSSGKDVPEDLFALFINMDSDEIRPERLVKVYNELCFRISPVTPESIIYTNEQTSSNSLKFLKFMSDYSFVREFILVSLLSLCVLVFVSITAQFSYSELEADLLNNSGFSLLFSLILLMAAASLGASFYILSEVNRVMSESMFSHNKETYYWINYILGLIGGIIISELIDLGIDNKSSMVSFDKLALALLGGFSSKVIYRILEKLITMVELLVKGDEVLSEGKLQKQRIDLEEKLSNIRQEVAMDLIDLQNTLSAEEGSEVSKTRLKQIIEDYHAKS